LVIRSGGYFTLALECCACGQSRNMTLFTHFSVLDPGRVKKRPTDHPARRFVEIGRQCYSTTTLLYIARSPASIRSP